MIPKHSNTRSAYVQAGAVENVSLRQVSAGRPVIAQTGGKSLAASCEAQT